MCHVLPVRVFFDGMIERRLSEAAQDRVARTPPSFWIGIVSEDRVLKLPLEPIESGFRRLFRWHQSKSLWH
jgi:hypothetical protein